jgi:hypothetical protein
MARRSMILLAAFAALLTWIPSSHAEDQGTWVPAGLPSGSLMVYDSVGDRALVFGGTSSAVWQLPLSNPVAWTALPATGTPAAIPAYASAAYDPIRNRLLVFDGSSVSGGGKLWALSLSGTPAWTQLFPAGASPASRYGASCIYDPVRDRLLIYGGQYTASFSPPPVRDDVWQVTLSGTLAWNQLATAGTTPPGRGLHGAIYDPVRDRMIVYAGTVSGSYYSRDMWALSLSGTPTWSEVAPSGPVPPASNSPVVIYDPLGDRVIMTNGNSTSGIGEYTAVWSLPLSGTLAWSQVAPTASPVATSQGINDPVRHRLVLHGAETWALALSGSPVWSKVPVPETKPGSIGTASYDPVRDQMIVVGGAETWALSLGQAPSWTFLNQTSSRPVSDQAQINDPVRDRTLIFGGTLSSGTLTNGVWALPGGTSTWVQITTAGSPPYARAGSAGVYDPIRDRMLVFGGYNSTYLHPYLNETWELSLSDTPTWTQLAPVGDPPSGRRDCVAIYDPQQDRMLVFGGSGATNDVWALSLSGTPTWTQLSPSGTPPSARSNAAGIYDSSLNALAIFGGSTGPREVWRLSLGTLSWAKLLPAGPSPGISPAQPVAVYDPGDARMVICATEIGGSVWTITWYEALLGVPPAETPTRLALAIAGSNPILGGHTSVSFTLPTAGRARLQVFDVQGRAVCSREVGSLGSGPHVLSLPELANLTSGVYQLRLEQGGRAACARAVILR